MDYTTNARILVLLWTALSPLCASAQQPSYPMKPLRIVVAIGAGGADDGIVRTIAQPLSTVLGQQVVVDNRAGAGGLIGWQHVAKAAPDGYTIGYGGVAMAVTQILRGEEALNVSRDFAPLARIGTSSWVLVIHPSVSAKTAKELIALARAHPGQLTYASVGAGNMVHLSAELFKSMAGIDILHVPYKSAPAVYNDLIPGRVSVYFGSITSASTHVLSGKLRALGVTAAKRSLLLPDVPTIAEAAVPGYEVEGYPSLHAPAGVSREIVGIISSAMKTVVESTDVRERLLKMGVEPRTGTPEEVAQLMNSAVMRYGDLIRRTGIKLD